MERIRLFVVVDPAFLRQQEVPQALNLFGQQSTVDMLHDLPENLVAILPRGGFRGRA
jgi:hypothetical protein